jgi:hypothetical protein
MVEADNADVVKRFHIYDLVAVFRKNQVRFAQENAFERTPTS